MQALMTYGFEFLIHSLIAGMFLVMPFYQLSKLEK